MGFLGRRGRRAGTVHVRFGSALAATNRSPRVEVGAVTIAGAAVAAQWAGKVAYAFDTGMTHLDTICVPRAVRGRVLPARVPARLARPHRSAPRVRRSDVGAPACRARVADESRSLLAARQRGLGRARGAGRVVSRPSSWRGRAVRARRDHGALATDARRARSRAKPRTTCTAAALLLASVAILFEGGLALAPTTIAGLAAGLALSTKLTAGAPVLVLTIGIVLLARQARARHGSRCCGAQPCSRPGSYWFVRNIVVDAQPGPLLHVAPRAQ